MDAHVLTSLTCRKCEGHDVIEGVGVEGVGRVEGQGAAGAASQVEQVCGVHHGNREAALAFPLADRDVLWSPLVVTLTGQTRRMETGQ